MAGNKKGFSDGSLLTRKVYAFSRLKTYVDDKQLLTRDLLAMLSGDKLITWNFPLSKLLDILRSSMKVISQFTEQHIRQVHLLYKQVWWGKERTYQDTKNCIQGSQICIGILGENNNLVGFTRVISDFIYKAIIFDVIVCDSQRGNGLGKKLMSLVKNHSQLNRVKHFELYCLPEMAAFYSDFGFSTDVGGIKLMRCINA